MLTTAFGNDWPDCISIIQSSWRLFNWNEINKVMKLLFSKFIICLDHQRFVWHVCEGMSVTLIKTFTFGMRSSPVTTATFRLTPATSHTFFRAAAQPWGFTPPALLTTFIPKNITQEYNIVKHSHRENA